MELDLVAVRAELKVWEKSFKAREGRDPSKADIKANPDIGQSFGLADWGRAFCCLLTRRLS